MAEHESRPSQVYSACLVLLQGVRTYEVVCGAVKNCQTYARIGSKQPQCRVETEASLTKDQRSGPTLKARRFPPPFIATIKVAESGNG